VGGAKLNLAGLMLFGRNPQRYRPAEQHYRGKYPQRRVCHAKPAYRLFSDQGGRVALSRHRYRHSACVGGRPQVGVRVRLRTKPVCRAYTAHLEIHGSAPPAVCHPMYNSFVSHYTTGMEPEILFVPSAFKHGATREDIRHAHDTRIYEGPLEGYDNKHAFIGFNLAGNPIEVFYNPIDDDTIKVFHAMGCRGSVIAQFGP